MLYSGLRLALSTTSANRALKAVRLDEFGYRDAQGSIHEAEFNPKELREFRRALADLRSVAGPIKGRPEVRVSGGSGSGEMDAMRERQRRYLRRVLRHLSNSDDKGSPGLAQQIVFAIHGDSYRLDGWERQLRPCFECHTRNRLTATYCDHCGCLLGISKTS